MVHAIIQRTKTVVSQYQTGLVSWMPSSTTQPRSAVKRIQETWPPSLPILSRWRNSACDCLDILHWEANGISAKAGGWEPFTIFHLHLSRLILLTPTGSLQTLASALSVPRERWTPSHSRKADVARSQVLRWAVDDQFKARLAVIHSGALFWHVRRYSIDSFLEPFGVYMAALVLWAYSLSVQFLATSVGELASTAQDQNQTTTTEQLGTANDGSGGGASDNTRNNNHNDISPNLSAATGSSPMTDLDDECEPLQFHIDRPCDDEIVQAYVKHGQKMSGHLSQAGPLCQEGVPRKILLQGQRILQRRRKCHVQASDDVSTTNQNRPHTGEFVWGVADRFIEMLGNLSESLGTEGFSHGKSVA